MLAFCKGNLRTPKLMAPVVNASKPPVCTIAFGSRTLPFNQLPNKWPVVKVSLRKLTSACRHPESLMPLSVRTAEQAYFFISDTSDDRIVTTNPKFAIPAEVVTILIPNH